MTALRVAPIVEGDGEVPAVPILLRRIGVELCGDRFIDVLKPILKPRERIVRNINGALQASLDLAVGKLKQKRTDPAALDAPELALVLIDADEDAACRLGPSLQAMCRSLRGDLDSSCVLAVLEFETWFVAAARSLAGFLDPARIAEAPLAPETACSRKAWIKSHSAAGRYAETIDQPRLTAMMDLSLCRARSPSFDKLCREIERWIV